MTAATGTTTIVESTREPLEHLGRLASHVRDSLVECADEKIRVALSAEPELCQQMLLAEH